MACKNGSRRAERAEIHNEPRGGKRDMKRDARESQKKNRPRKKGETKQRGRGLLVVGKAAVQRELEKKSRARKKSGKGGKERPRAHANGKL